MNEKKLNIRELQKDELDKLLALYQYLHDNDDNLPSPDVISNIWDQILKDQNI